MITTTHRSIDLATLSGALQDRRTRSVDVVLPAADLRFLQGAAQLTGIAPSISADGVTEVNGVYRPTAVALEGVSAKLNLPLAWLRTIHAESPELFDLVANAATGGRIPAGRAPYWEAGHRRIGGPRPGNLMLRLLRSDDPAADGYDGVVRAVLSSSYRAIDDFDVLLAVLAGLQESGAADTVRISADITERRMIVRIQSNAIGVNAATALGSYRSPYSGRTATELPMLWAGMVVSNSDVGNGAFSIVPRGVFEVCSNGMTVATDAMRKVHLGAKMEAGVVRWSEATVRANLELVKAQAADAVRTFMTREYWAGKLAAVQEQTAVPVTDPVAVVAGVSKSLGFTAEQQNNILAAFISGGSATAGGVMQAVTAAAQMESDGDTALDMELQGLRALEYAATRR